VVSNCMITLGKFCFWCIRGCKRANRMHYACDNWCHIIVSLFIAPVLLVVMLAAALYCAWLFPLGYVRCTCNLGFNACSWQPVSSCFAFDE
jgi:hypothetical protein